MRTLFGRPLWHNPPKLISYTLDGNDSSKQVFDIYSCSHVTHGILLYGLCAWLHIPFTLGLYISLLIEVSWELFENSEYIIQKYRTSFPGYDGDSVVNIVGDIMFTVFGYVMASYSPALAIVYACVSEVVLMPYKANFLYLSIGHLLQK